MAILLQSFFSASCGGSNRMSALWRFMTLTLNSEMPLSCNNRRPNYNIFCIQKIYLFVCKYIFCQLYYMTPITIATGLRFPEGPAFDRQNRLWCVEQHGAALVCIKDGQLKRIPVGGCPNGIAIDEKQLVWFCDSGSNTRMQPEPKSAT